ncbi:MAG TPA: FmdB family zinc ribbon protein, partial [Acidimicrobiales bacterium]|nr:FmdB family zinc ribbon protein [Acidimicrobiales bacterium]
MPTYEYQCQSCARRLEAVQSFHDPALTTCEVCGGELRKVFSPVGIVFKGSGFYKNDSRPKSTTSDAPSSSTTAPATPAPATPAPAAAASSSAD